MSGTNEKERERVDQVAKREDRREEEEGIKERSVNCH
jgi:hypothetical protein